MMIQDPIIEELRQIRREIENIYNNSETYYQHLLDIQKQYRERLTTHHPKPALVLHDTRAVA